MFKGIEMLKLVKEERREMIIHSPTFNTKLILDEKLRKLAEAKILQNIIDADEKAKEFKG